MSDSGALSATDEAREAAPIPARLGGHRLAVSFVPGIVFLLDALILLAAALLTLRYAVVLTAANVDHYLFAIAFVLFATLSLINRGDLYDLNAIMRPISRADAIFVAVITAFLFLMTIAYSLKVATLYSGEWLLLFGVSGAVGLAAGRVAVYVALKKLGAGRVVGRSLVVLGTGEQARQFLQRLRKVRPHFTSVIGVFDDQDTGVRGEIEGFPILGGTETLLHYARTQQIDDVVVALPWNADSQLTQTVERLKELPVNVFISTDLVGFQLAFRPAAGSLSQLPMFEVVQRPISGWASLLKLIEDYVLATAILIVLSPLLLLIAVAIKIESPGPVLFLQKRLGFNNKIFHIYKFRSMYHERVPEERIRQATRSDPRITRVGRIIRRTSVDELPQLLNVLDGTMSLVGPRPHALSHNEEYGAQIRGYFARHKVKPGITGWAQVNGLRGETSEIGKMEARVLHDVYYAENWSLLFDLRILATTVFVVLFQRNAY